MASQHYSYRFENPTTQRYYRILVSADLFGEWIVTKIWGGIGTATGRVIHMHCANYNDAIKMMENLAKIRIKRGYKICN